MRTPTEERLLGELEAKLNQFDFQSLNALFSVLHLVEILNRRQLGIEAGSIIYKVRMEKKIAEGKTQEG